MAVTEDVGTVVMEDVGMEDMEVMDIMEDIMVTGMVATGMVAGMEVGTAQDFGVAYYLVQQHFLFLPIHGRLHGDLT